MSLEQDLRRLLAQRTARKVDAALQTDLSHASYTGRVFCYGLFSEGERHSGQVTHRIKRFGQRVQEYATTPNVQIEVTKQGAFLNVYATTSPDHDQP